MWGLGICSISLLSFLSWRYINGADIYWFVKCSFDSNHLEFTVNVDLLLGYVLNKDRDTSKRSMSIFLKVIV